MTYPEWEPSEVDRLQAKARITDRVSENTYIIEYAGRTFEEHILQILKEKSGNSFATGGLVRGSATGDLHHPAQAGTEKNQRPDQGTHQGNE